MRARIAIALAALVVVAVVLAMARGPTGQAATPAQIEEAVTNGLAWLADQQKPDGHFESATTIGTPQAATCLTLTKFEDRGWELYGGPGGLGPFDPNYQYSPTVVNGLNYVFGQMFSDPTTGVYMHELYNSEQVDTYTTGTCMMALAASRMPLKTVTNLNSPVSGWTYQHVLQGMLTWMEGAQWPGPGSPVNPDPWYTGGWAYYWGSPHFPDNSVTGYATLGIRFATSSSYGFGLTISNPNLVPNLTTFISNVQGNDGGSWYEPHYHGYVPENILKTGYLLDEMALVGMSPSDLPVVNAVSYIGSNFYTTGQGLNGYDIGWQHNGQGDYQAMFAMMKGLEAYGITTLTANGLPVDWFDEVSTFIYNHKVEQSPPTSTAPAKWYWTGTGEGSPDWVLETSWALLTLEKVVAVPATPVPGPVPQCVPCAASGPGPAMQSVPLAGLACNPVVSTYPNGTATSTMAGGVTSTGSFTIWSYSPFTGVMYGYSSANPSNPPSDLTSLNCLDAFYICVDAAGTWLRPLIQ